MESSNQSGVPLGAWKPLRTSVESHFPFSLWVYYLTLSPIFFPLHNLPPFSNTLFNDSTHTHIHYCHTHTQTSEMRRDSSFSCAIFNQKKKNIKWRSHSLLLLPLPHLHLLPHPPPLPMFLSSNWAANPRPNARLEGSPTLRRPNNNQATVMAGEVPCTEGSPGSRESSIHPFLLLLHVTYLMLRACVREDIDGREGTKLIFGTRVAGTPFKTRRESRVPIQNSFMFFFSFSLPSTQLHWQELFPDMFLSFFYHLQPLLCSASDHGASATV